MERIALTRASEFIQVTDTLERLGVLAERMIEQAGLPMWHYCDPDDLIPKHHIYALMDHAARSLGSPAFGLLVGTQTSLSSMGSLGRLVANSLTTYHALTTGSRLIHLHNAGSHLSLAKAEVGDEIWFCHSEFPSPKIGRPQKEQYVLMRMIDHVRVGVGSSWQPAKVCLQTQAAPAPELREALGDPEIRVEQKVTAIALPRALLARQGEAPCEATDVVEKQLWHTAPATSFVDALRQLAETLLKVEGPPRIQTMAEITGLSVRTLQRRLARDGLSHFEILDQARYQVATRLLEDPNIRITDIAMDVGYTDSAHFTRAFRRWAGVTPKTYRYDLSRDALSGTTRSTPRSAATKLPREDGPRAPCRHGSPQSHAQRSLPIIASA